MITIRIAHADDQPALRLLYAEINRQHHAHSPQVFVAPAGLSGAVDSAQEAVFWRRAIDGTNGILLIAEVAAQVVGFVSAKMLTPADLPSLKARQVCRIGTLVVTQSLQGQGIGRSLMEAVEHWARKQQAVEIRLEVFDANRAAIGFYDAAGFGMQSHIMTKAID